MVDEKKDYYSPTSTWKKKEGQKYRAISIFETDPTTP